MKVVVLAGGYGTRISEESEYKPKPMINIGSMPILWHILKSYSYYGFNDFIICCGYKGHKIKEFFADYYFYRSDITFDFRNHNQVIVHKNDVEPWRVTLVDTGLDTMTGGRIKRIQSFIGEDSTFMLTYGDGVSDVNIQDLVRYHQLHGRMATITSVQVGGRFGVLDVDETNQVSSFNEKRIKDGGWINGGFMVLEKGIFDLIDGDATVFEREPLEECARIGELMTYKHSGFWQCMDTLRDKKMIEGLVESGEAPWIKW